jgi:phosphatidylserine/phosphatidylglycerophosphate/cardiolipin synthase-like enzyme
MTTSSRGTRILTAAARRLLILPVLALGLLAVVLSACGTTAVAAASPASAPLQVITEPQAGVTPFVQMIDGAHASVDLTMYELFDHQVEHALAADAARGVDVRVVLNGGYYSEHESTNASAYSYLHNHGVHVHYSPTYFALTHQKTLTVDGRESAIMTLNFDGRYSSTRDYAVPDRQPADVAAIQAAFNADYAGQHATATTGTGDLVWSPGAAATVSNMIESARRSIDLENEEMAYAPAIGELCDAAHRGAAVHLVMTYSNEWRTAFSRLQRCGVSVRLYHCQRYYIHAKMLIIDGQRALVSSQNLSTGSLQYNRELGIAVTTPAIVTQLAGDFASDYAGA